MNYEYSLRVLKVVSLLCAALYGSFVVLGNVLDFNSNLQYVQHVLTMDSTFEDNTLMWRAIESSFIHYVAYVIIIIGELLFTVLAWIGSIMMIRHLKASAEHFSQAKSFGFYSYSVALAVWFFGFIIIGSEWFAMWQSTAWNGKQTAMDVTEVMIGFAIILSLREKDIAPRRS